MGARTRKVRGVHCFALSVTLALPLAEPFAAGNLLAAPSESGRGRVDCWARSHVILSQALKSPFAG